MSARVTAGLQALYLFTSGGGASVLDQSGSAGTTTNLTLSGDVTWTTDSLIFNATGTDGVVTSDAGSTKLIDTISLSNEYSFEAWVTSLNSTQTGPAHIMGMSTAYTSRNFVFGQVYDYYTGNVVSTDIPGGGAFVRTPRLFDGISSLSHVMLTKDTTGNIRIYVDGIEKVSGVSPGNLSNWDVQHPFSLGNSAARDAPWSGEIHMVAVYSRALTAAEISQNYIAGPQ